MTSSDPRDDESGPAPSSDPRHETEAERDDRNLIELLQELRVAGLGVQVLFGFLLSIPFTTRFVKLSHAQHGLYVAELLLAATATALLLAPVAYHRLVFRLGQKEQLVRAANVMAISGLVGVALAVSATVLLVVSFVEKGLPALKNVAPCKLDTEQGEVKRTELHVTVANWRDLGGIVAKQHRNVVPAKLPVSRDASRLLVTNSLRAAAV